MNPKRIAILGAGRSGIAVAMAAKRAGGQPKVFDSKPAATLAKAAGQLRSEGIELIPDFSGPFEPGSLDIVVTSPGVDHRNPILQHAAKSGIEVIGEIEFAYRISRAPIVAITGTNGKSTTTLMTWLCLKELGHDAILCGNIYGSGEEEIPLTESAANAAPGQVLVAEISSFQLEWVSQFRPRCAAITNITPDHLNRYDSFEDYAETKHRIYRQMGKGDFYICHSDPATQPIDASPDLTALHTDYTKNEIQFRPFHVNVEPRQRGSGGLGCAGVSAAFRNAGDAKNAAETGGPKLPVDQEIPAAFRNFHNIANAAMAGLLALSFDSGEAYNEEKVQAIKRALANFKGLAHRMQFVGEGNHIAVINNSMCTNPTAVEASSRSLGAKPQHLLIGGFAKNLDFSCLAGYLKKTGQRVYLFGVDAPQINSQLGGQFPVFRTMAEAFQAAVTVAKPGDVIMLAPGCASLDQFVDFRARGDEFTKIAKEWLNNEQTVAH